MVTALHSHQCDTSVLSSAKVGNVRYRKPVCEMNVGAIALHVTLAYLALISFNGFSPPEKPI